MLGESDLLKVDSVQDEETHSMLSTSRCDVVVLASLSALQRTSLLSSLPHVPDAVTAWRMGTTNAPVKTSRPQARRHLRNLINSAE